MSADPPAPRGLALVGLRGTGKSTVGRLLARRLGRPFADADAELEAVAGRPIRAIFADQGEPAFRDLEERVLADLVANRPGAVLATGGGAVLREASRRRLREFGLVVWLSAGPAALADRLRASPHGLAQRPALTPAGTVAELAAVLEARAHLYREVAHAIVETDGRSVAQVVEAVLGICPQMTQRNTDGENSGRSARG